MKRDHDPGVTVRRTRMSQAERTALSDQRMQAAAIELILEHGTHQMTLKEVGERAGYSRGLASERYGSKEALFIRLSEHFYARWAETLVRRVSNLSGLEAFLAGWDAVEDYILKEPHETRAMYILWYESIATNSELKRHHAGHHEGLRRDTERWIREGISEGSIQPTTSPARFSIQHCSFIFGIVYQWLINPEVVNLEEAFRYYRSSVMRSIVTPEFHEGSAEAPKAAKVSGSSTPGILVARGRRVGRRG